MAVRCQQNLRPRPQTQPLDYLAALDLVGTLPVTTSSASWQECFSTGQLPNCGVAEFQHCRKAAFQHHWRTKQFSDCVGACGSALRTAPRSALLTADVVQHHGQLRIQHDWMSPRFSTTDSSAISTVWMMPCFSPTDSSESSTIGWSRCSALRTAPHSALLDEPVVQHHGQEFRFSTVVEIQLFSTSDSSAVLGSRLISV